MLSLKVGKSRGRDYLSIITKYWDRENKQSRTKTVRSLGYVDELKKDFIDPIAHFKEVVAVMNQEIEAENKKFSISLNKDELLSNRTGIRKNIGYSALSLIYHELCLDRFCNNKSRTWANSYSINEIMKLLVFSRILKPGSKKKAFDTKSIFLEKMDFSLEDVYRSLTKINTLKDDLQIHIHKKVKELYDRDSSLVYYDVTNYYFEIDSQDEMRKKGVSKEHRPDPIIQMGLFTDSQGIPIAYKLFPGNTNDCKTLIPQLKELNNKYSIKHMIVVADKGLNTAGNISYNILAGNGYVFSQSVRGANKDLKDFVLSENGYKSLNEGFKSKSRIYSKTISVTTKEDETKKITVDEKQVAIYSDKYARKTRKEREAVIRKSRDLIANPSKYNKAASYGANKYVKNLVFDEKTGEIINSSKKLILDEEKITEEEKYDGYYVIVTSEINKSDEEILNIYKGLLQIEEAFRITKGDLESRPVYLSRHDRIEAHFLTCFIALVVARLLAYRLDNKYSITKIASSLNSTSYSFISQNIYVGDYIDEVSMDIKEKLNLDFDKKFMTYGELRKLIAATKKSVPPVK